MDDGRFWSERVHELSETDRAHYELLKVASRLQRAITPKRFYEPAAKMRPYNPPRMRQKDANDCSSCGRPLSSWGEFCIECFQKRVRMKYQAKVSADRKRIRLFETVFNRVTKRLENDMAKTKQLPVTSISRTTTGLRDALFEEMDALRNGNSNAQRARSLAMMANSILQSVQVEIEYHKYVSAQGKRIEGEQKVVTLGTSINLGGDNRAAAA